MGIQTFIFEHGPRPIFFRIHSTENRPKGSVRDAELAVLRIGFAHNVSFEQIIGRSKKKAINRARIECYAALKEMNWSLPDIGRFFDNRDHTTVLYGLRRLKRLESMEEQPDA